MGLLGRPGAGACPNLPQRRPAAESTARRNAEYQRFFSRTPARSGPLWQIRTNAAAGPGRGPRAGRRREMFRRPRPRSASIAHLVWWDDVSHAVTRPGSRDRHLTREIVPQPASTSLNPRARLPEVRARGLSDVLGGYPMISRTAAPGADPPRTPRRAVRPRERRSDRRGPAERKWSAQESTAMSPLNNLPGEPHWPPGSRADRIRFNRARRSGRSSTAVTTRISMSVDQ